MLPTQPPPPASPCEIAAGGDARRSPVLHVPSDALDEETARLVAGLTGVQRTQLATYRDLLLDWNQKVNLTALTDPAEVERRLFLDAVRMLPAVDDYLGGSVAARLVDIGTGAGFPGLVLAIARPHLDVALIEATGKKIGFLRAVVAALHLSRRVSAFHGRAEDLARDPTHRGRFDLGTARAVAVLPALLELTMPYLRRGGRALFPKSAELGEELAQAERAARMIGARIVGADLLAHGEGERVTRLVIADKMEATPSRYPRRAGIPAREPLGRGSP